MLLRTFQRRGPAGPARPMTPGRLARRMLLVAALLVAAFLAERGSFQRLSDGLFGARVNWHSDYSMSEHLYDLIVRDRLTNVSRACLLLNIHGEDPPDAEGIDVFERPTPACMGSAAGAQHVLPRLFGLRVDRDAGTVETDAGTPGRYRGIR